MKKLYTFILAALLLAAPAMAQDAPAGPSLAAQDAACDALAAEQGYPWYYCDCTEQSKKNRLPQTLPFDITVTDTTWYRGGSSLFMDGCTAFLYSECDIKLIVMQKCENTSSDGLYKEVEITSNQARDVEPSSIKDLMNQYGVTGNMVMRIGIAPAVPGTECRFICAPYNQGPASTCEDCLPLIPEMVFVTSHPDDVYAFDPSAFISAKTVVVEWFQTDYPCQLQITRGTCDGTVVASTFLMPDGSYEVPTEVIDVVRGTQEKLYFHFIHANGTAGRFRLVEVPSEPTAVDAVSTPSSDARLVLGRDGIIYIQRGNQRYTLMGTAVGR